MFLTVIGLGSDEYAIAWSHGSDDSPQMAVTRDHGDGVLSFEQLWNGVLLQTRARVVSHESRGITECSEAVISIKSIHGEVSSVGKRLGGLLYERKPNPEEC
jgi:hypothetical protein